MLRELLRPFEIRTIGLHNLLDEIETYTSETTNNFPHYDIIEDDHNKYRIVMALAGYDMKDVSIDIDDKNLTVACRKNPKLKKTVDQSADKPDDEVTKVYPHYIHQGISTRNFYRHFTLGEHVKITEARFTNGLLTISLEQEIPERAKPTKVEILT